ALMACLPVEVRKAIEVFEEDGRELSLNDIILKARSLLKKCGRGAENAAPLAAGGITSGKYCHNCKVVGHTAAECTRATGGQRQSRGRYRKPRGSLRCYNCQEQGHIARNCPRRRDQKDGQSGGAGEAKVSSAKSKPQGSLGGAAVEDSEERQGFRPHLRCQIQGQEVSVPVDTGCDCSLITADMAMRYGASILPVVTPVVLRLMDASTTLSTVGQAMLTISFMVGGSWRTVSHNFQVVNKTVFGPMVVGSDFASQYCQGMRWGPDGGVTIAGAAEVSKADDDADGVVTYKLDNILGVEVTEKSDGSVTINSSDFILTKGPSEDHFTCKWIWLNDVPPPPIRSANQGDYAPRLTEEEEASLREEAKKLVDNHWIRKYDEQID
ncbi:hypothetical protein FOZ62_009535, partial [Perkinsus olseni]